MGKRGIAFSGGGSRGQFHVGVARKLIAECKTSYDVYAGVSVGALVAACLAQYKTGDEAQAVERLEAIFSPVQSKDIWRDWFPFGKLSLWKQSFLNSEPLEKLVRRELDIEKVRASGKELRVGAVSINKLTNETFSQSHPDIVTAVIASAAMPAFFKPVNFAGQWWTDGGIRETTPIKACLDAGCDEIDVVICQPEPRDIEGKPSLMQIIGRAVESMSDEIVWRDYKMAVMYNRLSAFDRSRKYIKLRLFSPVSTLNEDALKFDPGEAKALQQEGYQVATALLTKR